MTNMHNLAAHALYRLSCAYLLGGLSRADYLRRSARIHRRYTHQEVSQ